MTCALPGGCRSTFYWVGHRQKHRIRSWNRISKCHTTRVISTSGLPPPSWILSSELSVSDHSTFRWDNRPPKHRNRRRSCIIVFRTTESITSTKNIAKKIPIYHSFGETLVRNCPAANGFYCAHHFCNRCFKHFENRYIFDGDVGVLAPGVFWPPRLTATLPKVRCTDGG